MINRLYCIFDKVIIKSYLFHKVYTGGPIPGVPVLDTFLQAGNETVGYFLMRNMRNKHRQKESQQQTQTTSSGAKVYGCEIPKHLTDEIPEHPEYELHPTYRENLARPKANTFGLGYVGLREQGMDAAKIFNPASLTVHEKGKKKLSISGQAFGVGAFEEDDEDIYVKEDMSKYDYEMTGEAQGNKATSSSVEKLIFGMFTIAKGKGVAQEKFPPPIIPASFSGKHNVKKSRFEPVATETPQPTVNRKEINASIRAKYLGESDNSEKPKSEPFPEKPKSEPSSEKSQSMTSESSKPLASTGLIFDKFVSASQTEDISNILEEVKPTGYVHGTQEMQDAARMKMFGPLTRVMIPWTPTALLCKRFNVPEPSSRYDILITMVCWIM